MQQADRCRFLFFLIAPMLLITALAGCNSGESFSDGTRVEGPVSDTTRTEDAPLAIETDPTIFRTIGLLANAPLSNVGFRCGGISAYTGSFGLPQEQERNYFVCPESARFVTFFVGGEESSVNIGTAWFECDASGESSTESCEKSVNLGAYEAREGEALPGAPAPILLSLSDIVTSPARVDPRLTGEDSTRLVNMAAFLQSLDISQRPDLIEIDDKVHDYFNANAQAGIDLVDSLSLPFADFVATGSPLDAILLGVQEIEGDVGVMPQSAAAVRSALIGSGHAVAAGIYRLEMESTVYTLLLRFIGDIVGSIFPVTDTLSLWLGNVAVTDVGVRDAVLFEAINFGEYFPYVMIDRRGRAIGGGGYDIVDVSRLVVDDEGELTDFNAQLICNRVRDNDVPEFFTLAGTAAVGSDLTLKNFFFDSVDRHVDTSLQLRGRLFNGRALHGVTRPEVAATDFQLLYPYPLGYEFKPQEDAAVIGGVGCGIHVPDVMVNSFYRVGLVEPFLDDAIMSAFFGPDQGPAAYDISFWAMNDTDILEFPTLTDTLPVTIHSDGTILTNLQDPQLRNLEYDTDPARIIPSGEFLVGMVTSIVRDDEQPDDPQKARLNLILFPFAGAEAIEDLPAVGKRVRGQLVPDLAGVCDNRLVRPGHFEPEEPFNGERAPWFGSYTLIKAAQELDVFPFDEDEANQVRRLAYGVVEARLSSCVSSEP